MTEIGKNMGQLTALVPYARISAGMTKKNSFPSNVRPLSGSVDFPWGIIELVLWRTALQADTYWTDVRTKGVALGY